MCTGTVDLCRRGRDGERAVDVLEVGLVDAVFVHVDPVGTHCPEIAVKGQPGRRRRVRATSGISKSGLRRPSASWYSEQEAVFLYERPGPKALRFGGNLLRVGDLSCDTLPRHAELPVVERTADMPSPTTTVPPTPRCAPEVRDNRASKRHCALPDSVRNKHELAAKDSGACA